MKRKEETPSRDAFVGRKTELMNLCKMLDEAQSGVTKIAALGGGALDGG